MASFAVHKQWEEAHSSDVSTVSWRIVETTAKLLRAELKVQKYDVDSYPSVRTKTLIVIVNLFHRHHRHFSGHW